MPDRRAGAAARGPGSSAEPGPLGVGMRLTLASLAAWRLTHLLAEEDGPMDAVARMRERLGENWAASSSTASIA